MLAPLLASQVDYPPWLIIVVVLGAGGFGAGIWAMVAKGWNAFKGISEILQVLRGNPGGDGTRKTEPLVDVVDGLAHQVQTLRSNQESLETQFGKFRTDLTFVKRQVTGNGGDTNTIADRVVRLETAQTLQVKMTADNRVTDAAGREVVRTTHQDERAADREAASQ